MQTVSVLTIAAGFLGAVGFAAEEPAFPSASDLSRPPDQAVSGSDSAKINGSDDVRADFDEVMDAAAERQRVFTDEPSRYAVEGNFSQGGLVFGQTETGASVRLDGKDVMVGDDGRFVFGFGRDAPASALLVVSYTDGFVERRAFEIAPREFPVQRIDGLDQSKVSGFTPEQLAKIARDRELKDAARRKTQSEANWADGFSWPVLGPISGVFGSQRILNGEPKRPHSGVDIAAPEGAAVRAPAPGVVTLAEEDMYFEGGLVLIDHGHWVESAYLHLSRIDVSPGQIIKKGDPIGAVGATGRVTGPHLHWSMKWAGTLIDPFLLAGEMPPPDGASGD